jgi:hypothetical protein
LILLKSKRCLHGRYAEFALLSPFLQLRRPMERRIQPFHCGVGKETAASRSRKNYGIENDIMDDSVQKSCWGLTAKAVIGIAGIIVLFWLVSGAEAAAVLAS